MTETVRDVTVKAAGFDCKFTVKNPETEWNGILWATTVFIRSFALTVSLAEPLPSDLERKMLDSPSMDPLNYFSHRTKLSIYLLLYLVTSFLFPSAAFVGVAGASRFLVGGLAELRERPAESEDLFDYFDVLLSPHAYPNGISSSERPQELRRTTVDAYSVTMGESERQQSPKDQSPATHVDPNLFFDPTISPHQYSQGTPDRIIGDNTGDVDGGKQKRVGILLMDHGSRNPNSNRRLFDLAQLYQQSLHSKSFIVAAAHMEIASPTIRDGIASLLKAGVDGIICHPYFLSPGRHVQEDIPRLVKEAIHDLDVKIPVVTTDPVGANTDLMIKAIHGMVDKARQTMYSE